jgi:hypothetical protein
MLTVGAQRLTQGPRPGRNRRKKPSEADPIDLVENRHHRPLNNSVLLCSDAQWTLPPIGLRIIGSS